MIGTLRRLEDALALSEDSDTLNTAYIERLNLTLRRSVSYLARRSPGHARCPRHLADQLELTRCYYNFLRPHRALKFRIQTKTPAMQAGLASERPSFREVFLRRMLSILLKQMSFLRGIKLHRGTMAA